MFDIYDYGEWNEIAEHLFLPDPTSPVSVYRQAHNIVTAAVGTPEDYGHQLHDNLIEALLIRYEQA